VSRTAVWELTPRQSIERECARRGTARLVAGCLELLHGRDADDDLVVAIGGPHARAVLDSGPAPVHRYWLRVWAARTLLYVWDDSAAAAVRDALSDDSWRVREMAVRVVARRLLGDALPAIAALRNDPVPRVRAAAARAEQRLTAALA
jgi:hypothetical protein